MLCFFHLDNNFEFSYLSYDLDPMIMVAKSSESSKCEKYNDLIHWICRVLKHTRILIFFCESGDEVHIHL